MGRANNNSFIGIMMEWEEFSTTFAWARGKLSM
jgi:hypothetical protein